MDLKPLFEGSDKLDRDALYWHFPHNRVEVTYYMGSTILEGDWKFYKGHGLIKDALFNLKDDPLERSNVLANNPELANRLRRRLNNWLEDVSARVPRSFE